LIVIFCFLVARLGKGWSRRLVTPKPRVTGRQQQNRLLHRLVVVVVTGRLLRQTTTTAATTTRRRPLLWLTPKHKHKPRRPQLSVFSTLPLYSVRVLLPLVVQ
jgi:hypothetical protein